MAFDRKQGYAPIRKNDSRFKPELPFFAKLVCATLFRLKWKFGRFGKLSLATVRVKTVKGTFKACKRFTVIL